jgi:hypothetical protein
MSGAGKVQSCDIGRRAAGNFPDRADFAARHAAGPELPGIAVASWPAYVQLGPVRCHGLFFRVDEVMRFRGS